MRKLVSFVESIRVGSALTLAFLVSLAWVLALALLLRITAIPGHPSVRESRAMGQRAMNARLIWRCSRVPGRAVGLAGSNQMRALTWVKPRTNGCHRPEPRPWSSDRENQASVS